MSIPGGFRLTSEDHGGYLADVLKELHEGLHRNTDADVRILCRGCIFRCHSAVLAATCNVFSELFNQLCPYVEKNIIFPSEDVSIVEHFISLIYGYPIFLTSEKQANELLTLLDSLGAMIQGRFICEEVSSVIIPVETCYVEDDACLISEDSSREPALTENEVDALLNSFDVPVETLVGTSDIPSCQCSSPRSTSTSIDIETVEDEEEATAAEKLCGAKKRKAFTSPAKDPILEALFKEFEASRELKQSIQSSLGVINKKRKRGRPPLLQRPSKNQKPKNNRRDSPRKKLRTKNNSESLPLLQPEKAINKSVPCSMPVLQPEICENVLDSMPILLPQTRNFVENDDSYNRPPPCLSIEGKIVTEEEMNLVPALLLSQDGSVVEYSQYDMIVDRLRILNAKKSYKCLTENQLNCDGLKTIQVDGETVEAIRFKRRKRRPSGLDVFDTYLTKHKKMKGQKRAKTENENHGCLSEQCIVESGENKLEVNASEINESENVKSKNKIKPKKTKGQKRMKTENENHGFLSEQCIVKSGENKSEVNVGEINVSESVKSKRGRSMTWINQMKAEGRINVCSADDPKYKIPLEFGWTREMVQRQTNPKMYDVYYFTPERRKLRSYGEVGAYLARNPSDFYGNDSFYFRKDTVGHPNEIVRMASSIKKIRKSENGVQEGESLSTDEGCVPLTPCKIELVDIFASFGK